MKKSQTLNDIHLIVDGDVDIVALFVKNMRCLESPEILCRLFVIFCQKIGASPSPKN